MKLTMDLKSKTNSFSEVNMLNPMDKNSIEILKHDQIERKISKFIYPSKIMTQHIEKQSMPRCIFILPDHMMQSMIQANCLKSVESFTEFLLLFGLIEEESKLHDFETPKLD
jgi:hypothetical protein